MTEKYIPNGTIFISRRAIATIAAQSALESYGIVGLAPKNLAANLANVLVKDPMHGVDIAYDGINIEIDLYLIVEYGLRITTVAQSAIDSVRFHIEKAIGVPVTRVDVHVRGLRISDTD